MSTLSLELNTADRLARGEICRVVYGDTYSYKLNKSEWAAYEAAKSDHYLVLPGRDKWMRAKLRNVWCAYTEARRWPLVVVEPRKTWAHVEIDMILVPPPAGERGQCWNLDAVSVDRIRAFLDEHAKPGKAHAGRVYSYSGFVPVATAPFVARRLFQIAGDDIMNKEEAQR